MVSKCHLVPTVTLTIISSLKDIVNVSRNGTSGYTAKILSYGTNAPPSVITIYITDGCINSDIPSQKKIFIILYFSPLCGHGHKMLEMAEDRAEQQREMLEQQNEGMGNFNNGQRNITVREGRKTVIF